MTDDEGQIATARDRFSAALSARLEGRSARELAPKVFSGRTVVTEIKSGRRLPSEQQLDALLEQVGADEAERAAWAERLKALRPASVPLAGPSDEPTVSDTQPAAHPRAGGFLVAAAAVIILVLAVAVTWSLSSGGAESTVAGVPNAQPWPPSWTSASPSSKGGAASTGTIEVPADESTAGSAAGVRLAGTFSDDGVSSYWLLDRDSDGTYTVDLPVTRVNATSWQALNQPIGDPANLPTRISILLVRADDDCAKRLRAAVQSEDSTLAKLGKGCEVLDRVTVTVDRP